MKKSLIALALAASIALPMTSCYTMTHKVGNGGTGLEEIKDRQWFFFFGLVTLNTVTSHDLAAGVEDYTVTTEWTWVDILMNTLTVFVTVTSQEVSVSS